MTEKSLQEAWDKALREVKLENQFDRAVIKSTLPLGNISGTILLSVTSDYAKRVLESRISGQLISSLSQSLGYPVRIAVSVEETTEVTPPPAPQSPQTPSNPQDSADPTLDDDYYITEAEIMAAGHPDVERANSLLIEEEFPVNLDAETINWEEHRLEDIPFTANMVTSNAETSPEVIRKAHLNPLYTFDSFVTGASNRFTSAAARAVAETPARAYNPLFIYGGSGLGKTHLMHAIGHYALSLYPNLKVKYVSSEAFTNDFINSIREDRAEQFQRRYREIDILLIDDIQFIQGKEQTMEEFFHTFNALHTANKQVVITSDVPPKKLEGFEDRMRSRFEMGLLTDVQPPDLETRIAILQKKARLDNTDAPVEVLEYIASRISTNIRELEGALIRVTANANLSNQKIDLAMTEMVLKDIITDPDDREITPALIMMQTADYFNTTVEALCSSDRSRMLVDARQIAMYLCRELTDLSLPAIGKEFGGRDHTTVMHANKKISNSMTQKHQVFNQVAELTNRIKQQARN